MIRFFRMMAEENDFVIPAIKMMMTNETKESKEMEKSASLRKSYAKKVHRLRITNNSDFFFFTFHFA